MPESPRRRAVLVHGAATTSRVWRRVVPLLTPDYEVLTPDRACSGDLATEVADLAAVSTGAVVGGVSGGATLGLALLASGVPIAGAVLHEPAAGSLAPGLLDAVAAAWQRGGLEEFAATLYGPVWTPEEAPPERDAVARELPMFRAFEPAPLPAGHPPAVLTVGELSPPARHDAVAALADFLGLPVRVLSGTSHAVHLVQPAEFAAVVREMGSR